MESPQVRHINEVKKSLGNSVLELLTTIFDNSKGSPPAVPVARFRADHSEWMDQLDSIANSGILLKWDHGTDTYRVSGYALPLIESQHAKKLLARLETVYTKLRRYYRDHLRQPLKVQELLEMTETDSATAREALCYMRDVDGWWSGMSTSFPMVDDGSVLVNEQVLKYESFGHLISRVYEWHFINPKERANTWPLDEQKEESKRSDGFFTAEDSAEQPIWFSNLDDVKKALIIELDVALRHNLSALPTIGIRTLLERVMAEHVSEEGGFREKLERFVGNGFVTTLHADLLRGVLDVGHASAHRAYFPNEEDVRTCIEVVKHLMHGLYVLHPKVQKMSGNTPIDPRKRKKPP